MPNDPLYQRLLETSWRRPLTSAEEAELNGFLAAHVESQADWEVEAALNQGLEQLPRAAVPSNFTARILDAVRRKEAAAARLDRERGFWLWFQRWLPRGAIAGVVLTLGVVSYQQARSYRIKSFVSNVEAVSTVSGVTSLPSPAILADFDAIRQVSYRPNADEELLALLK